MKNEHEKRETRGNQHVLTCFGCVCQIKLINDTTPNVIPKIKKKREKKKHHTSVRKEKMKEYVNKKKERREKQAIKYIAFRNVLNTESGVVYANLNTLCSVQARR